MPGGSRFLGTFDRETAVANESIDFYASGHPLVEGILADLEDSQRGRVGLVHLDAGPDGETGFGIIAISKDGPRFTAVALDSSGRERPEWAERLSRRPLRTRRVAPESWIVQPDWGDLVRSLASHLQDGGRPALVLAFRIGGSRTPD